MALEKFSIDSLKKMDGGRVAIAFEQALKRCQLDCSDRPGLKSARKISLIAVMTPVLDEEGNLDSVDLEFEIKDNIPARKSRPYNMQTAPRGGLLWNEFSPEDVRQLTLDEGLRAVKGTAEETEAQTKTGTEDGEVF